MNLKLKIAQFRTKRLTNILDKVSSIRNTKLILFVSIFIIVILLALGGLRYNQQRNDQERNTGLAEKLVFEAEDSSNVKWEVKVTPGTVIGDTFIENPYYTLYYSEFYKKYIITIKKGDYNDINDIQAWILENIKQYEEFKNGVDIANISFIDDRSSRVRNQVDPQGEGRPIIEPE